jgi:hypothetical protein
LVTPSAATEGCPALSGTADAGATKARPEIANAATRQASETLQLIVTPPLKGSDDTETKWTATQPAFNPDDVGAGGDHSVFPDFLEATTVRDSKVNVHVPMLILARDRIKFFTAAAGYFGRGDANSTTFVWRCRHRHHSDGTSRQRTLRR